jgi:ADP-heptose:LPS heptosyltransferase
MKNNNWEKVKEDTLTGKTAARIKKLYEKGEPIKVIIYNNLCVGDVLVMGSSILMLHQQYPGRFITDVACPHRSVYDHNPYIIKLNPNDPETIHLWTTYPLVNRTNQRPVNFMEGYVDWFRTQFDIDLILDTNRPHIFLSKEEKVNNMIEQQYGIKKFWVINAGWKNDYTCKRWSIPYMQEVVNHFKNKITFVQIGQTKPNVNHPPLDNVINLIDKTNVRQLMVLCYHAQGGIGPITCIQHMFAAYNKSGSEKSTTKDVSPYIVLHGAREPVFWTAYHNQKVFSNIGTLPCAANQACWKSRVVPLGDGDKKDKRLCELPMTDSDGRAIAKCMLNIKPKQVIEAIESYHDGGVLKYE